MKKLGIAIITVLSLVAPTSFFVAESPVSAAELTTSSALHKALPATVTIVISKEVVKPRIAEISPDDAYILKDIGEANPVYITDSIVEENVGAGSGVIISHDGYILTNKHVVLDTDAHYTALLADGTEKSAHVVYRDPNLDIAIVKIEGVYDNAATLGSSKNLKVGQPVIAIGNAYGQLQNSVSVGTISAFNRNITAGGAGIVEELSGLLQSSTDIVPGYSGGPLIDANGNVVAINVAKDTRDDNTSFSIPIDDVKSALNHYPVLTQ